MESIKELLKRASGILKEGGHSQTPILDSEVLLVHALLEEGKSFDRLKLLTQQEYQVETSAAERYMGFVKERSKGKPVQYITQCQEFMGLELHVSEGVLIPRGDTEVVVEKVIDLVKGTENPHIIDMCTGSGAIAVSLASFIPDASVWAVDISDIAIQCCKKNISLHGLNSRVAVIKGDLFENIQHERLAGQIDVIVSNPPYIQSSVIPRLEANVRDYEPHLALDGGEDGLVYYRRIVQDAASFLKGNGMLVFEIGYDQSEEVRNIMEMSGYYVGLRTEKDLAGFDRCVWGYRKR